MTTVRDAYDDGQVHGETWIGPNGDGSLGALSHDFIVSVSELYACGWEFDDLRESPTPQEVAVAEAYRAGFYDQRGR